MGDDITGTEKHSGEMMHISILSFLYQLKIWVFSHFISRAQRFCLQKHKRIQKVSIWNLIILFKVVVRKRKIIKRHETLERVPNALQLLGGQKQHT